MTENKEEVMVVGCGTAGIACCVTLLYVQHITELLLAGGLEICAFTKRNCLLLD
jgi:hypothetical protein